MAALDEHARVEQLARRLDAESSVEDLEALPMEAYVDEPRAQINGHPGGAQRAEARPTLAPVWFQDAEPNLARRDIVGELLGAGALGSIYGGPGSGKTFFALDLALAVARGILWSGRTVTQGIALYAAGEGHQSVLARVAAYRLHHFGKERPALPFATIPAAINLLDPSVHVDAVTALAKHAEADWTLPTALIVIDTLARAMAGADENSGEDMGAAIRSADLLRERTGAHVLLVHHTGKSESGARGHSSLKAALDTEIEVTGIEGVRIAKVTKQRDLPIGALFGFELKSVVIGTNPLDNREVTSCVLEHVEAPSARRREPVGKNQVAMLSALQEHFRTATSELLTSEEWRAIGKAQGIPRQRFREVEEGLCKFGWLKATVGGWRYLREPE
jgi:hypothetical protein